jgi:hypothetical protein
MRTAPGLGAAGPQNISLYLYSSVSNYPSVYLSIHLSLIHLSVRLSTHLSTHLSIYVPSYLSVRLCAVSLPCAPLSPPIQEGLTDQQYDADRDDIGGLCIASEVVARRVAPVSRIQRPRRKRANARSNHEFRDAPEHAGLSTNARACVRVRVTTMTPIADEPERVSDNPQPHLSTHAQDLRKICAVTYPHLHQDGRPDLLM